MTNAPTGYLNAVSIGSGESADVEVDGDVDTIGDGATLTGIVERASTSYDVDIVWLDAAGNEILTESVASGVTAGNQTTFDQAARSPYAIVRVSDAGSGSGDADAAVYIS